MAKDFLQDCPEVQFTDREENADYKVKLNHLELGLFIRDNQIAVMDAFGFAFHEREEQYPAGGQRCLLSDTADWSNQASFRQKMIDAINGSFRKEGSRVTQRYLETSL